ncbi:Hypothetical protein XNRR2_3913 [Streptomyces albidoflavus]|nr:hypothetical protein [Streptomyces albidoflavus]BDH53013.1 hypothetical protein MTP02_40240 [Streptomyces albus]AGI90248.1 Hypothetical protein XNR_3913 [Streptomyces albidoflavus]QLP94101.1 Hypothetical protein XNRR2_3913 [Streptomyces albidoflavus]WAE12436.1 Hypothetical protein SAD14_3913 [Streptomyces albidoflavus]WAE18076.1 Hypothetical protein SAD14N_3913 [Streptomyces albidoflavus]
MRGSSHRIHPGTHSGTYGPRELRVALPPLVDPLRPAGPGPR